METPASTAIAGDALRAASPPAALAVLLRQRGLLL